MVCKTVRLFKLHHSKSGIAWLACRPTCFLIVTQVFKIQEKHPHKVCMFSKPFWATVSQSRFTFNNHLLNLCPIKVTSFQELAALILITGCQAEETGSMCQACHREMLYPHLCLSILSVKGGRTQRVNIRRWVWPLIVQGMLYRQSKKGLSGAEWTGHMERGGGRRASGSIKRGSIKRSASCSQKVRVSTALVTLNLIQWSREWSQVFVTWYWTRYSLQGYLVNRNYDLI